MTTKVSKPEDPMDVYPVIERATKAGRMSKFKAMRVKTKTAAHVTIRNRAGRKLFDLDVLGVSITVAVPPDTEIQIEPSGSPSIRLPQQVKVDTQNPRKDHADE